METNARYKLAGGLSIAMAVLGIPMVLLAIALEYASHAGAISALASRGASDLLSVLAYGVGIYLYVTLRHLFETRHGFRDLHKLLAALIYLSAFLAVCTALGVISANIQLLVGLLSVLALVAYGILSILFGVRLLRLNADLSGMRKPYAYTCIAVGVCYASVLLLPVGLLISVANDIMLALIFFGEAKSPAQG